MENSEIITWVLGIICAVVAWLLKDNVQQGKKLVAIETKLDFLTNQVSLFLKTEMDTLKELIDRK